MPFWCLSPVRVVYHGSFRENLESSFRGLGLSYVYHNLMKHMQVFKTEHLKCCSFDASPQSEWLITAHLERIWGQHFGALDCHITTWLGRCKSSKRAPLKCCSFDASPLSEWLITAHLERIWSQHFGALGCHIAAWLGRCKSSKKAPLEYCRCLFDASPQSEWFITALESSGIIISGPFICHITTDETHASLQNGALLTLSPVRVAYHGSFRENLGSAFWGFGLSYHNLIRQMQVFKTEHLKCCSFDASPLSEWLITAHLERIWSQHFGALGCHIAAWLGRCEPSKGHLWNVAVLMPLPSQSGLSRLI